MSLHGVWGALSSHVVWSHGLLHLSKGSLLVTQTSEYEIVFFFL